MDTGSVLFGPTYHASIHPQIPKQSCLYDDEKEKVVDMENSFIVYKSKHMDDELTKNFGNKDKPVQI